MSEPLEKASFRQLPVLLGILLSYVAIQFQLPHETFWSNDAGEKLLQVRALVENGPLDPAIPYDPLGIESPGSFRFAPLLPLHATVREGRLVPIVPIYFPLLSSLPYRVLGEAGLYVLPIVFSILTLALLGRMASESLDRRSALLALIAAGLASPIFFYSLTFWEHTMAMCLATTGIFLIHRSRDRQPPWNPRSFAAGAVMAVGAWVRGDVYFVILAVLVGLAVIRRFRPQAPSFLLGALLGLAPSLLLNLHLYGDLLGPQVTAGAAAMTKDPALEVLARQRWDVLRHLFLTWVADIRLSLLCVAAAVAPLLYFRRVERWSRVQQRLVVLWGFAIVAANAFTFAHLFTLQEPMLATLTMLGLWPSLPILPFAFVQPRSKPGSAEDDFLRLLFVVAAAALVGLGLGLPYVGGLQWGPRYTLVLFPVLVLLSLRGYAHLAGRLGTPVLLRSFRLAFLALVLLGICTQGFGIRLLAQKKQAIAENNRRIEAMAPSVIVTDTWWVPEESADLYERIPMYLLRNSARIGGLVDEILAAGQEKVLLVSHRDLRRVVARHPKLALSRVDQTSHDGIQVFDVLLLEVRRAPPGRPSP